MTPKRKSADDQTQAPILSLPQLCSDAADHVARARVVLYDETLDADQALLHLDDAIACLKRLLAHGRTLDGNGSHSGLRTA
ncbi:hypothetical protein AUC69_14055 [Methyloceanibacter superfactus]|uniref:Uncharacterized protein n=1 Tax=Methyloceanibacter superfactus TaxID=1774969 RepID=A0A1E3VT65_9HYPH|nr:hypothetical protein AUC69_14055 [Methyloceanibacter superfactus]